MKNHKIFKRDVYGPTGKVIPSRRGQNDSVFITETWEVESFEEFSKEACSIGGHVEYLEWVRKYAINFLTIRNIPTALTNYDSDGNIVKFRVGRGETTYDLRGYIKAKYDHIPAAQDAAILISLTHRFYEIEESNMSRKFDILADTAIKLKNLNTAHMEAFWLAGKSRTGEASQARSQTKSELIELVKPWLDDYLSQGDTKSFAYNKISKRLGDEQVCRSKETVKGWFNGR